MIKDAQERLKGVAQKTGLSYSNSVSDLAGCEVYLKLENLQAPLNCAVPITKSHP